ncbi:hypothetical protein AAUPMC_21001 [Pasteurella multocida subsp. multocida str. Anand1_cattle]|nr:hypothetical protein AAUPMC_21001 [Pasteurella multocida subsp. multocida str. Anand1_cattle]
MTDRREAAYQQYPATAPEHSYGQENGIYGRNSWKWQAL